MVKLSPEVKASKTCHATCSQEFSLQEEISPAAMEITFLGFNFVFFHESCLSTTP